MKKGDIVIIAVATMLFALSVLLLIPFSNVGNTVTVKQNNQTVYENPLDVDTVLKLDDNTVVIKDGVVYMKSAGCKNQVCVNSGKISKKGESIVCLPNKVTVAIS